jgi:hypothetical protein
MLLQPWQNLRENCRRYIGRCRCDQAPNPNNTELPALFLGLDSWHGTSI